MNNLVKRSVSGIVFIILMVGGILYGSSTYSILFALITALSLQEFHKLIDHHHLASVNSFIATISGVYLFLATFCWFRGAISAAIFLPYLLSIMYLLVSELYQKDSLPLANWAYTFLGQVYIALPFSLMNFLAFRNGDYSPVLPLSVFIFIWVNDTGAYCFGTMLNKKIPYKLFERISPKKSWIGSIGGGLSVFIVAALISTYYTELSMIEWLGLGLTVIFFATWGDLVESMFKRQLQIKDSGNFMPGHGGILDRFDSSLLAIPASVTYLYFISSLA